MSLIRVDNISSIPLFYDRYNDDSYGVSAVPMRPYIDERFYGSCVECFDELQELLTPSSLKITQIWSGGVGRSGSGSSLHHRNRAFDLDALIFEDNTKWVADTFPQRPFMYLAIESVLRRHFGTVLNFDYNSAHEDHFHFDNGTSVKFKRDAKSHVLYLQHCLVKLYNQDIGQSGVDGMYGGDTDFALRRVRSELGIGGISDRQNWLAFLKVSADWALEREQEIVVFPDGLHS